ncbi:MAG: hypothetical protein IKE25_14020 [Clostridia bacterium]|nr:hypothetical protein [Clostridia bacterium]
MARLIDADALAASLTVNRRGRMYTAEEVKVLDMIADYIRRRMDELPGIDAAPVRRGTWEYQGDLFYLCSVCGRKVRIYGAARYCPNCGAKMSGGETDAE